MGEVPRSVQLAIGFFDVDPILVFASLHREKGPSVIQTFAAQLPLGRWRSKTSPYSTDTRSGHKYHTSISPVYNLPRHPHLLLGRWIRWSLQRQSGAEVGGGLAPSNQVSSLASILLLKPKLRGGWDPDRCLP